MKTIAILVLFLAACGDNLHVGPVVTELCGMPPSAPGYSAFFDDQGHAVMPRDEFIALDRWHGDVDAWFACVTELP